MNKIDEKKLEELFPPVLILILGYVITIVYFYINGDRLISSDSASDLILANLLNRDGGILSHTWFYSTELIIFDTQFVFKPALLLFPNDWHMARTVAHAVLMALYLISMLWVIKVSKIGVSGLWAVAACSLPIGWRYVVTVSWGMFYVPNFVFTFAMIALLIMAVQSKNKAALYSVLLFVVSFMSGVRTLRTVLQVNIPLVAVAVIMLLCRKYKEFLKCDDSRIRKIDRPLMFYTAIMFVASVLGYCYNSFHLMKGYFFTNYNMSTWERFSLNQMISVTGDFIEAYGWHEGTTIISIAGISSCFGLLLGIAVTLSVIFLFWKHSKILSDIEYFIVLYTLVSTVICIFIFAHNAVYFPQYWVPIMPFGYMCLAIAFKYIAANYDFLKKMKYGLCCGALLVFVSTAWLMIPLGRNEVDTWTLLPVISWIEDQGYTKGVSSFWYGNFTTEISDGKIEMWVVDDFEHMNIYTFLQETSHVEFPDDDLFVILSQKEYEELSDSVDQYIIHQTPEFTVLGFEAGEDYRGIITEAYKE